MKRTGPEQSSLEDHCEESSYKYFVNFLSGHNYAFSQKRLGNYNNFAVSKIY